MAHEYRGFEEIYFPHMLDFRGRMYPIPRGLHPQGEDLARGLLEFADGKEITGESGGRDWLALHLSACWGFDKASYEDRIAWVEEREDLWRKIAADPLDNLEWAAASGPGTVDKPFRTLAAIFEWVGFLEQGFGFVSHIPVSVDGTCNGIQHLSAMTRDEDAGRFVNLVPADRPQDIYKHVARRLQADLERIEADGGLNAEHAAWWLDLCNRDLPRSLTKRQVMVLPYGGTRDSFFKYTRDWLNEAAPAPAGLDSGDEAARAAAATLRGQRIAFLSNRMWDLIKEVVAGGMTVMAWLQKCARQTVDANQPLFWTTPSGFVVRHFYGQTERTTVRARIDGTSVGVSFHQITDQLDAGAQLRGVAPNFVHSLDAAALHLSLVEAKRLGIVGFTAVHDAYGTHAADMWPLFHVLREAFVLVHSTDMLGVFRASCARVGVDKLRADQPELDRVRAAELMEDALPRLPLRGRLDLAGVLGSDYFFS